MPFFTPSPRWFVLAAAMASLGCTVVVNPGTPGTPVVTVSDRPSTEATPRMVASPGATAKPVASPAAVVAFAALSGFVLGDAGMAQPVGGAKVVAGNLVTYTAAPSDDAVIEDDADAEAQAIAAKGVGGPSVYHDFDDGRGAVLCELRARQQPVDTTESSTIFLRPGEFFLEGVPEGEVNLSASFDKVQGASTRVFAPAGRITTDLTLRLSLPEPVVMEDGRAPEVVQWVSMTPETGLSVAVVKGADGETTLNYKPAPPEVVLTFVTPPGSAGATIAGARLTYEYATPERQMAGKPNLTVGPFEVPITAVVVPAASDVAPGERTTLTVAIARDELKAIFGASAPDQQPGIVIANLTFVNAAGEPVLDRNFLQLTVSAAIRAL